LKFTHLKDMRVVARARLEPLLDDAKKSELKIQIHFAMIEEQPDSIRYLVAAFKGGDVLLRANHAALAVMRVTRGTIKMTESPSVRRRDDLTIEGWRDLLASSCRSLNVDPALLGKLARSFPKEDADELES